jgi:hypothetical protein
MNLFWMNSLGFMMNEIHVDYGSTEFGCETRFEAHLNYWRGKKEEVSHAFSNSLNQNEKQEIF